MKKVLFTLFLLCSVYVLNAQSSFYATFVDDTIVLSVNGSTGSLQWQETTDTTGTWTDIPAAVVNNYNYRITAIGTGFKFFRAKITNPSVCSLGFYFSRVIKCRIVSNPTQIVIGDIYAGGYVIYKNGYNGVVAALSDQGTAAWGCSGTLITGAAGTVVGTGQLNTTQIVGGCAEAGIAAKISDNLTVGGYSDWYLPSIDEITAMYALHTSGKGNFSTTTSYWSSSQNSATDARAFPFNTGNPYLAAKTAVLKVRSVRSYSFLNVQQRLDAGETPFHIFTSGMPMDSLYGKIYVGGLLFYMNTTNGSGIVASQTNLGSHPVGNTATSYGCGGGTGIGDGPGNTGCLETIFTANGTAADTCSKYIFGIYDDWFLPSSGELYQMWANLRVKNHSSWQNEYYWSSTNEDYNSGKVVSFVTTWMYGNVLGQSRTAGYPVRAARNFSNTTTAYLTQEPNVAGVNEITPNAPVITNTLPNKTVCLGNTALFYVAVTGDPTINFYWQKNGVTISGTNNDTLIINSVAYTDTATYRCIAYNGCDADTSNTAWIKIPVIEAGSTQSVCANNPELTLAGMAINAPDAVWSGGNGSFTPNANATNAVYIPTATEIDNGSLVLTLSSTAGGLCPTIADNMTITFTPAPVVEAGTNQNLCSSSLPINLNGSFTNSGGAYWSGGSGTFNPFNTAMNAMYNPSLTEINTGSVTLTLTSSLNGNCLAVYDQVTYNISKAPTANAGSDIVICNSTGVVSVSGSITNAPSSLWSGGAGGFSPNNASLSINYYPTLQEISNGEVTLILTTSASGYCQPVSDNVHITFGPEPVLTADGVTDVTCFGFCNGTATISVTSGTQPFEYLWPATAGNLTIPQVSSLCAGSYTVSVSDAAGCVVTTTVDIYQPDMLTASVSSVVNNQCYGGSEGIINLATGGGTSPFTYHWSNGTTLSNAYGLAAGSYFVTVIDARGCYKMLSNISITQRPKINVSVISTNAMCNQSDGTATATANGGTGSYDYLWSNNSTSNPVTGLEAGSYFVIVSDVNDCNDVQYFSVSNNGGFTLSAITQNVSCSGNDNGSINMTIAGGSAPFDIEWSNGDTTEDISGLIIGPYDVIVTDIMGCMGMESFNILDGALLSYSSSVVQPQCNQSDGEISITVAGGETPYTYIWSNGATTPNLTGLAAGNYAFTATDNDGCITEGFIGLTNAGAPIITTDNVISAPCGGDGSAFITISGGTSPFEYHWSDASTNEDLINVAPGMYHVTVTDFVGCATIEHVEVPVIDLPVQPICIVTVDTTYGRNLVVWERTSESGVDYYNIYRETSVPNQYQNIAMVNSDSMTVYLDMAANPFVRSFRYKVSAVDMCGNETAMSDFHKTMHLTMNQGIGTSYNLIWDDYEGFNYNSVIIMRYLPSTGWLNLDTLPKTLHSYTDVAPSTTGIKYLVRIDAPNACSPTSVTKEVGGPYSSSYSNMEDEGILVSSSNSDIDNLNFILYPNPAKEILTLKSLSEIKENMTIEILDYTGKVVFSQSNKIENETRIDISGLSKGLYLIEIKGKSIYHTRFVVE